MHSRPKMGRKVLLNTRPTKIHRGVWLKARALSNYTVGCCLNTHAAKVCRGVVLNDTFVYKMRGPGML
jgi:hypothetical protein